MTRSRGSRRSPLQDWTILPTAAPSTACAKPYMEPKPLPVGTGAAGSAMTFNFMLRLNAIKETIFAMDKTLIFPEVILLRIEWGPGIRSFWRTPSNVDCATTATDFAGTVTLTNMSFFLAVEQNALLIRDLTETLMNGGFTLAIPFITVSKTTVGASTSQTVSIRIGGDKGQRLKKIVHAVFNPVESKNTSSDHINTAGAKVTSYQTRLDSTTLQNYVVTCANYMDWALHPRMITDTALLSSYVYQYHWFHCDDFADINTPQSDMPVPKENLVAGITLDVERLWSFSATTAAATAFQHFTIIITYKTLRITSLGVDVI